MIGNYADFISNFTLAQEAKTDGMWKYHIEWYNATALKDTVVVVNSKSSKGSDVLRINSWTNYDSSAFSLDSNDPPLTLCVQVFCFTKEFSKVYSKGVVEKPITLVKTCLRQ